MRRSGWRYLTSFVILSVVFILCLAFTLAAGAIYPAATGEKVKTDGGLVVDYSHADDGYVMAKIGEGNGKKYKLRVYYGDELSTYDLKPGADFEAFPLQYGSGEYSLTLFKNVKGNKYSDDGSITISASMSNEQAAFLCASQYVNFTADTPCVAAAEELCAGLSSQKEIYQVIHDYVVHNFGYDFVASVTVKGNQLPDIDGCWNKKMGICQDLSAMTCAMLRSQGVVARLMIGYANETYHAWVVAVPDGEEVFFDPTAEVGGIGKNITYTVERYY